jgi:DNA-binding GntR family transcriptional regulator
MGAIHWHYEGLVEQKQNQLFVKQYTMKEIVDVYQCRKALESMAASLAVDNMTEADEQIIRQIIKDTKQSVKDGNQKEIIRNNTRFHNKLVALSKNQSLIDVLEGLGSKILFYRNTIFRKYFRDASFLVEHEAIFQAILSGNHNKAKQAMEQHIDEDINVFLTYMKKAETEEGLKDD